jgi:protocatechuate 3,4-dioxygenase beta subunit
LVVKVADVSQQSASLLVLREHIVSTSSAAGTAHANQGHDDHEDHEHDLGLSHDLPTILNRRRLLSFLGGAGAAVALAACGSSDSTASTTTTTSSAGPGGAAPATDTSSTTTADGEIPEETAGPYPGDGSNGVNVLTESGIVRSDLTKSFGSASGVAAGVPLTIKLKVIDVSNDGAALAGSAVYLWHCNQDGEYSLYSDNVKDENYLRGVQEADADGSVTFTSIFPAAYSGRWPHIHFEVYPSLAEATTASSKLRTTQLALPEDACNTVYATDGYEASLSNMKQTTLASDNIFSDGYSLQLAKVTGSVAAGYTATLNVPV